MRDWLLDLWVGTVVHNLGIYLPFLILVLAYFLYKVQQRRLEYEVSLRFVALCLQI